MMELTQDEKRLMVSLLQEHVVEVEETEKIPNQHASLLGAEVRYVEFVKGIMQKLE